MLLMFAGNGMDLYKLKRKLEEDWNDSNSSLVFSTTIIERPNHIPEFSRERMNFMI